jgi:hypothetical protein
MATTAYSEQGFVYLNYFFGTTGSPDLACETESFTAMYPVNYCYPTETFAMKLQLTEGTVRTSPPFGSGTHSYRILLSLIFADSCTNGIVQYFSDEACTHYLGSSSLEGNNSCAASSNAIFGTETMRTITCTTDPSPSQLIGGYVTTE